MSATFVGAQIQVDSDDYPANAAVGTFGTGGFVVAWEYIDPDTMNFGGLKARFYLSTGQAVGPAFNIAPRGASSIAFHTLSSTQVLAVWEVGGELHAQKYNNAGDEVGFPFQINSDNAGTQHLLDIVELPDGGFRAFFMNEYSLTNVTESFRDFSASGASEGDDTEYSLLHSSTAKTALLTNGNYVVVDTANDDSGSGVGYWIYDKNMVLIGEQQFANNLTAGSQYACHVVALTGGGFAIAWTSELTVKARVFDADGAPVGDEFSVDKDGGAARPPSSIAATPNNGFVVTWNDQSQHILAQRFHAEGADLPDNTVSLAGGTVATELVAQAVEAYDNTKTDKWVVDRRGWHDVTNTELGIPGTGAEHDGTYTYSSGHYHQANVHSSISFFPVNDTDVTVELGMIDGVRTLSIAFKGSDAPWKDPSDWTQDVSSVDDFYEKHRVLVDALKAYAADSANGIDRILVTGHSLGGAMTQELVAELRAVDGLSTKVDGYTFGSIGALNALSAGPDVTNFLHVGDIANALNQLTQTRAGALVYLEPQVDIFDGAGGTLLNSLIKTLEDGKIAKNALGAARSILWTAFGRAIDLHDKALYQSDLAKLIAAASDADGLFYGTNLAASLRDGTQWTKEDHANLSGQASVITVFVGGDENNEYEVKATDDYAMGAGGRDRFIFTTYDAVDQRVIDGGSGTDLLILNGNQDDFETIAISDGRFELKHWNGSAFVYVATIDRIEQVAYRDTLDQIMGDESVQRFGVNARVSGVPTYTISHAFDYSSAGDGPMTVNGTAEADILYLGRGDKTIVMGDGDDIVVVRPSTTSGTIADKVDIDGGKGADMMYGGRGNETYHVDDAGDVVRDAGGKDAVIASISYQLPTGIETLTLTGAATSAFGNGSSNRMTGNSKANTLDGQGGSDTLLGGSGSDTLTGGLGKDTMTGGSGSDKFLFNARIGSSNVDGVTDFRHNTDIIQLDDAIFAKVGSSLSASEFYAHAGATKAHDASDRIIYNKSNGRLYYDDDGNKAHGHAAVLFATLSHHPSLDSGDFRIV